jgi:drug/metabolite transporter (DMT)-like permease
VAVLLGLAVAVAYGAADFLGGLASKRAPLLGVLLGGQLTGVPVLAVVVVVAGGEPTGKALLLGGLAGMGAAIGIACLYRGLAIGRMAVVAPITAVGAAVLPVGWGLATGERPSGVALAGVFLALVAVVLVSSPPPGPEARAAALAAGRVPLLLAVVSGVGFGFVFILLAETGSDSGLWPLVATRATSIALLAAGAVLSRQAPRLPADRAVLLTIAAGGALDMTANVLYVVASRQGMLALVAVVSALYPAATVVLARAVLGERIGRVQLGGIVMTGAGVVMIAAG